MEVELGYTIISRIVLKKFYINNLLHGVRRQADHVSQCITSYPINGVFIKYRWKKEKERKRKRREIIKEKEQEKGKIGSINYTN